MDEKNKALEYFANQLKKRRKEKGLSQMDLARLINMSAGSIGMYELGQTDPRRSVVKKLANVLDVDESYFYDYNIDKINLVPINTLTKTPIRFLGFAGCGNGRNNDQAIEEYIELPDEWVKDGVYASYASGDSMIGSGIIDGSLILLKDQPYIENGEIGVFHYNGDEYIKKYKKISNTVLLQSSNPSYEDIEVTKEDDFRIIAKVTRVITEL